MDIRDGRCPREFFGLPEAGVRVAGLAPTRLVPDECRKVVEAEASEIREPRWERGLAGALKLLARSESDLLDSRKGAEWKVATARFLRERYLAPHRWIADRLNMGGAGSVQTLVSRHRRESEIHGSSWEMLNNYEILD